MNSDPGELGWLDVFVTKLDIDSFDSLIILKFASINLLNNAETGASQEKYP